MSLGDLLHSRQWKVFMNYVYSFGGVLVIIGALFKLMHWPMAGPLLTIGMVTEAFVFFVSAFEPVHVQHEWEKVFPELKDDYSSRNDYNTANSGFRVGGGSAASVGSVGAVNVDMGGIFEKANIAPEVMEKVSKGLTDLGNTASSISDISSATLATSVYVENLNSAAKSMANLATIGDKANGGINNSLVMLNDSCQKITSVVTKEVADIENNTKGYSSQMLALKDNLSQLNTTYATQLAALKSQFESSQNFNQHMSEITAAVSSSIEEMKKYQKVSSELNQNIETLNSVYKGMLGAMNYKK